MTTTTYQVTWERDGKEYGGTAVTSDARNQTIADIPKMVEIKHGPGTEVTYIRRLGKDAR